MFALTAETVFEPCPSCNFEEATGLDRKHHWQIDTVVAATCRRCGVYRVTRYIVGLTEHEFMKLETQARHAARSGAKPTSRESNLSSSSILLWPKGTLEDVAMRTFGPWAMERWIFGQTTHLGVCKGFLPCCRRYYPTKAYKLNAGELSLATFEILQGPDPEDPRHASRWNPEITGPSRQMTQIERMHRRFGRILRQLPSREPTLSYQEGIELSTPDDVPEQSMLTTPLLNTNPAPQVAAETAPAPAAVIQTSPPQPDPQPPMMGPPLLPGESSEEPPRPNVQAHQLPSPSVSFTITEPPVNQDSGQISAPPVEVTNPQPRTLPGNSGDDIDLRAMLENGCIRFRGRKGDMLAKTGLDCGITEPTKIKCFQVGPSPKIVVTYSNTADNIRLAYDKRVTQARIEPKLTAIDKKRISSMIDACIKGRNAPFAEAKVEQWFTDNVCFKDLKSGKWTDVRLEKGLDELFETLSPQFKFKLSIKSEPSKMGKPRIIIADGDKGQIMAMFSARCFEGLLFAESAFESRSIKHKAREEALKAISAQMRDRKGNSCFILEGDGSSWDTCCSKEIRDMTENRIFRHITNVLAQSCIVPIEWTEAHMKAAGADKIKGFFASQVDRLVGTIPAIRRSGQAVTSSGNYFINMILTYCAFFPEDTVKEFLYPGHRTSRDRWEQLRWFFAAFEGDDSLVCTNLDPKLREADVESFWRRCGFNMKLVYAVKRCTFVGVHFAVDQCGLTGLFMPELPRAMANAGHSFSKQMLLRVPELLRVYKTPGEAKVVDELLTLASSGFVARAYYFAGKAPTVSEKFLEHAERLGFKDGDNMDEDHTRWVYGNTIPGDIYTDITRKNLSCSREDELMNLEALDMKTTDAELDNWKAIDWRCLSNDMALPASWK